MMNFPGSPRIDPSTISYIFTASGPVMFTYESRIDYRCILSIVAVEKSLKFSTLFCDNLDNGFSACGISHHVRGCRLQLLSLGMRKLITLDVARKRRL